MDNDGFIERKIAIGMIVSTDYLAQVIPIWNAKLLQSSTIRKLTSWCLKYYGKYNKAPNNEIETIFRHKIKSLTKDDIEDIEETLSSISHEYERNVYNHEYLIDQTKEYLHSRKLLLHANAITEATEHGDLSEADLLANNYIGQTEEEKTWVDPFQDPPGILRTAFMTRPKPLIKFSSALGAFWNDQFCRDGFVALLGPEKRGKTFMLMEIALKGIMSGCNVALFQAGDMSEKQQLMRLCIHLAGKSNQAKYCGPLWVPKIDCIKNQLDDCEYEDRACDFGIWEKRHKLGELTFTELINTYENNESYIPCTNCNEYRKRKNGALWLKRTPAVNPLTWHEVRERLIIFRKRYGKRFRLITYPNETLTMTEIKTMLNLWEQKDGLVFDIIIIDYADILAPDADCARLSSRDQNNKIWQRMRRLSQEKHCLLVTATQASASSYGKTFLQLGDFSEDKRKYAHVTAMYGLNQTDEEKKMGLMRLNEMVIRDGDFNRTNYVNVIGRLQMGRPILGSFW